MVTPIEFQPKEFPLHKPKCEMHRSDLFVVFTKDGQMDIAVYDDRTNLWYSLTDPTGFGVYKYTSFDIPDDFEYSKELLDLLYGEGDYAIKSYMAT